MNNNYPNILNHICGAPSNLYVIYKSIPLKNLAQKYTALVSRHFYPEPSDDQFANVQQDEHRLSGWLASACKLQVFFCCQQRVVEIYQNFKIQESSVMCSVSRHRVGRVSLEAKNDVAGALAQVVV